MRYTEDMLVCHCQAVNESTIRRCVAEGARDVQDVREACGAGLGCGGCQPLIDRLVELEHDTSDSIEPPAE